MIHFLLRSTPGQILGNLRVFVCGQSDKSYVYVVCKLVASTFFFFLICFSVPHSPLTYY